jgi:hypothetical protein
MDKNLTCRAKLRLHEALTYGKDEAPIKIFKKDVDRIVNKL